MCTYIYIEPAVRVRHFHPQMKTNSEDELRRRIPRRRIAPRGRIPPRRRIAKTNSPKTNCPPKTNCEDEFPEDELPPEDEFPPKTNSEDEFPEDEFPPRRRIPPEDEFHEDELPPEDEFPPEDELRRRIPRRRIAPRRRLFHQRLGRKACIHSKPTCMSYMHLVFILANRRDIFFVHGGFSPYNGRLCLVHLHIFPTSPRACHVRNWAPSSRNWRNHGHGFKGWFMDPKWWL